MLNDESVAALGRYPDDWRIGREKQEWVVFVPDDSYLSVSGLFAIPQWTEVARANDLDSAIANGLQGHYPCEQARCTVPRTVDQTIKHKHQLRPKSALEILADRAFPPLPKAKPGQTLTVNFAHYGPLEPISG